LLKVAINTLVLSKLDNPQNHFNGLPWPRNLQNVLWHADPFLGNARNTRTQQKKRYCKNCFLSGPCHGHY
jgi:hypothetical protein